MNVEEVESIYKNLLSFLKSNSLSWIADQVEAEIALGHIETKKLSVPNKNYYDISESFLDDDHIFTVENHINERTSYKTKKSNAIFVVSKPYDEYEKLKLLIDSIEIGVIRLSEIANETLGFIRTETNQSRLIFEPEADIKESYEINLEQAKKSYLNSRKLLPLLDELRKEL